MRCIRQKSILTDTIVWSSARGRFTSEESMTARAERSAKRENDLVPTHPRAVECLAALREIPD
jgi:hypothetical protein